MMELKTITYGGEEYQEMVNLRYKILREPLGLTFTKEDLKKDENDLLLAAFVPDSKKIIACCILSPISESSVQLRQMAVDDTFQQKGLGSQLLLFAERVAKAKDYKHIYLHARKVAVDFYKKHDYMIKGEEFTEVGIPHFEMIKQI